MPELPEVETVKEILKKQILGKRIINIDIYYSNTIENVSKEEFVEELKNEIITDIKRYGKYYLTFTGTHFLSDAYRVNYSSGNSIKDEKSLIKSLTKASLFS